MVRRPVQRELTRSSELSWQLHRRPSTHLTPESLDEWRPTILPNLESLRGSVQAQRHVINLDRWKQLVRGQDVPGLRRVRTGLDTDSVEMREVSPLGGPLSQASAPWCWLADAPRPARTRDPDDVPDHPTPRRDLSSGRMRILGTAPKTSFPLRPQCRSR
jgi:hypothetical protein